MKIENNVPNPITTSSIGAGLKPAKVDASAARASASANVQLSSKLQLVEGQAASAGVFDAQKVQDIKAAIAEGRFQVNSEVIADGLLATVNDLIRSHIRTA